jgi:magnesium transporter
VVNNNLSTLMKRLTVISIIFMPMNVLTGMGGMSEFSSWITGVMPWYAGYALFLVGLIAVGFVTSYVLEKKGIQREEKEGRGRRKAKGDLPRKKEKKPERRLG